MKDIVRILQDIATDKNLVYHYGKKAALNLLDGTLEADKIFMLHEFTNRKSEYNTTGTKIIAATYEGKFFLVKHSDYDQQYFAERGTEATSKFTENIEPLLQVFNSLGNTLACADAIISQWDNIDITDALDANMDGLLCSYRIKVPVSYSAPSGGGNCDGITNFTDFTTEAGENFTTKFTLTNGSVKGKTEFQVIGFTTIIMPEGTNTALLSLGLGNHTIRWRRLCNDAPVTEWNEKGYEVINVGSSTIRLAIKEPFNENAVQFPVNVAKVITSSSTFDVVTDSGLVASNEIEFYEIWNDINSELGVLSDPVYLSFPTIEYWQYRITPNDYVARPTAAWAFNVQQP